MAQRQPEPERRTLCTSCDRCLVVSTHAKSVSCPYCNQRVVTEDLVVKDYVAVRRFRVANRMRITRKALVYAAVRADELEIEGLLQGDAVALHRIHLGRKARVSGNLRASRLSVDEGATFEGQLHIGPEHMPELQSLEPAPTDA